MSATPAIPPLHAAVWEGNLARIRSILDGSSTSSQVAGSGATRKREMLEARDANGLTALHLATRVVQPSQRAIIQTLLEHGASVSGRSVDGWSCIHDATLCDDEFLLAQLFLQGERQLWREVEEFQDDFLVALEKLPDFEVEIFVEAYSWIPGVSKMLPSQTNRIFKRGSQLRVDSSMKGLERLHLNHGNISHIFTGRTAGSATGGQAFIVNHDNKTFYDISSAVNGTSSAAKIDLGLHMLLTKELSTTSIDSSKLQFTKLKDVSSIKTKRHNGATKRACPWSGTKYEMTNVAATFAFRNPVNPRRQHRQFAEDGIVATQAAMDRIEGFVCELNVSSSHASKDPPAKQSGAAKSMMDTSIIDDRECEDEQAAGTSRAAGSDQELWLQKGKSMEMHLDVLAGDLISWSFTCSSKDFSFAATSYRDEVVQPIARCGGGAKNVAIDGSFHVEYNGSFVLQWQNLQKRFTLDKKGVKIVYNVSHTRAAAVEAALTSHGQQPFEETTQPPVAAVVSVPTAPQSDHAVCQRFLRVDHIPNPMTVTMPFSEYFATSESDATAAPNKSSSIFKRSNKPTTTTGAAETATNVTPAVTTVNGVEYRNTFRSLTLLPTPRKFHKTFDAAVFMANDFPMTAQDFMPVVEFLAKTGDQVANVAEFFRMKLPPGFPVRFELPMMFTVRAAYTFQKAVLRDDIDPALFQVPAGYTRVHSVKDILPVPPS